MVYKVEGGVVSSRNAGGGCDYCYLKRFYVPPKQEIFARIMLQMTEKLFLNCQMAWQCECLVARDMR